LILKWFRIEKKDFSFIPLFQNAVLNKFLAGMDEKKEELSLNKGTEKMEYFNQ
jgi:hypothetical protein